MTPPFKLPVPSCQHHLVWALCLIGSAPAWAQIDAPLTVRAAYGVQTDSNLFRLPDTDPNRAAERITTATLGLHVHTQQSLQQLDLDASVVDSHYQHYDYLNLVASNYALAWHWSLTPSWTGTLRSDRSESQNSFADFGGSTQRNVHLATHTAIDTVLNGTGPWRILAGASTAREINQLALVGGGDFRSTSGHGGLRYVRSSGSSVEYVLTVSQGSNINRTTLAGEPNETQYQQSDNALRLHWEASGKSTVDSYLIHTKRQYASAPQRDFSGVSAGASLAWQVTGKTRLQAGLSHTLASYVTFNANYSETDRATLAAVWQISPRTSVTAQQQWAQISYRGAPAGFTSQQHDTTRDSALVLTWATRRHWAISTSVQTLARGSTEPGRTYNSTLLGVSGQFTF